MGGAFERLDPASGAPIAVAVSGGGDSLFALIAACEWAARHGRPVLALSVDHGLQPDSAAWTAFTGQAASRLGADFQALAWTGPKPATGLPAAARTARHRLIAEAARAAGCRVIVTGHTADDAAENALMGQGRLAEWSPSPVWPQGRGLFLLRPLLDWRRADIRGALAASGRTWIDDPANEDPTSTRVRARTTLQVLHREAGEGDHARRGMVEGATASADAQSRPLHHPLYGGRPPSPANAVEDLEADDFGMIAGPRSAFDRRTLAAALVSVGGGERTPRSDAVERLLSRLHAGAAFTATLAGARIDAAETVAITRDPGRAGPPTLTLTPGVATVWDGRFELIADAPNLTVRPLAGLIARLPKAQLSALRRIAASARASLPALVDPDGRVVCPILAGENAVRWRSLVAARFYAACGAIDDEHTACDVECMAKSSFTSYLRTSV